MNRRFHFLVATGIASVGLLASTLSARGDEVSPAGARPPELDVFEQGIGHWRLQQALQRDGGDAVESDGESTVGWVLGRRFAAQTARTSDREHYHLMTYDPTRNAYRSWYFSSVGRDGQWSGNWDPAAKTFLWQGKMQNGGVGTRTIHFDEGDVVHWNVVLHDADGKEYSCRRVVAKLTQEKKQPIPTPAKAPAADPTELAALRPLAGVWQRELVVKPAAWYPSGSKTSTKITRNWILGGRFLHEATDAAITLASYDSDAKAHKSWRFDAAGRAHEWTGQWDETTRTFTYNADLGGSPAVSGTVAYRLIDDDHIEWSAKAVDADGKVYFDVESKEIRTRD